MRDEPRLFLMFTGLIVAWYGVYRRDRPGTLIAIAGLGLADAVMLREEAPE